MKNILKYSIFSLLFVSVMSCSDDDQTIARDVAAPVLISPASGTNIVLNEDLPNNPAVTFVWNHGDYSVPTEINYAVEVAAVTDAGVGEYTQAGPVTSNRFLTLTVEELNDAAIAAGLAPFEEGDLNVRVTSTLGDNDVMPMVSNIITIKVTPYTAILPNLFLVGHPQAYYGFGEWSPENGLPLRYIGDGTTKLFEGYVKLAPGNKFKLAGVQGSWSEVDAGGNYGASGTPGTLTSGGGSGDIDIVTDGEGLYYIQVDLDAMTYKSIKMNWGIIGSSTPNEWASETPMTYNFADNKFTITTALTAGELKFRAKNAGDFIYNGEWKFNVGNSTTPQHVWDTNEPNFNVTAGTYTLELSIGFNGLATVTGL